MVSFIIKGIFSSGFYEFDQNVVFLNLNDTLNFFNKTVEDINLEIYLKNPLDADNIKEKLEKLEQLRALEAGMRIDAALVDTAPLGVDTPADLERARKILEAAS